MNYAQARRMRTTTNALRSAVEAHDYEHARDFRALRHDASALHLAGILCDSGCDLDAFAGLAATSSVVSDALAKAKRWRGITQHEIGAASGAPLHASRDSDLSAPQGDRARLAAHSAEDAA